MKQTIIKGKKVKSIEIIIETEKGDNKKIILENPTALILSGIFFDVEKQINEKKTNIKKGGIQVFGTEINVIFAFSMLLNILIKSFGPDKIIKAISFTMANDFKDWLKINEVIQSRKKGVGKYND
jgi:hypothetical protein